ncbi:MAG: Ig-like domain-containing protein [Planctomycetota bacterium]
MPKRLFSPTAWLRDQLSRSSGQATTDRRAQLRKSIECLEQRTLLAAVALPTVHLDPDADTGRSNSDNIVNSLSDSDFVIAGGSISGLNPSQIIVVEGPTLLEDGSASPGFSEGRHSYTAQMVVQFLQPVAGSGGGVDPNITFPAQFLHSSDALIVTIDQTEPDAPTVAIDPASNAGLPDPYVDRVTRDTLLRFKGTAEADSIVRLFVNDEFDGLTLANPIDGNDAFPDGLWRLEGTLDLNDPEFFPRDGLRTITVTAEDRAGNVSEEGELNIFIDTQGPQITAVDVNSQNNPYDLFSPKPSTDGPTPPVSSLVLSVQDLPFRSDEDDAFLYDALVESIAENPGHYVLTGDHSGVIPISAIDFETVDADGNVIDEPNDGEPAFGRITLSFDEFLPDDRFTLSVSDALIDPAANPLDGESDATGPHEEPTFPSGDGIAGGGFSARFTVDSRPDLGVVGQRSIGVDTNGNLIFDPSESNGDDAVNGDLSFDFGIQTDAIFTGQFTESDADTADGFDRLGAYGRLDGTYRWLLDFDNDGVPDNGPAEDPAAGVPSLLQLNAVPIAGDFDPDHPGDEIGFFTGRTWYLDTDGDNNVGPETNINTGEGDVSFAGDMQGRPIVGDFDGDGLDDLATHMATQSRNRFYFDLTTADDGTPGVLDGSADDTIDFGFPGVLEKPFAADFNLDGIDDVGLMTPNQEGNHPSDAAEWYILISDSAAQSDGTVGALKHEFSPSPLGNDLFAQMGTRLGLPITANLDPPVAPVPGELAIPAPPAVPQTAVQQPQQAAQMAVSGGTTAEQNLNHTGLPAQSESGQTGLTGRDSLEPIVSVPDSPPEDLLTSSESQATGDLPDGEPSDAGDSETEEHAPDSSARSESEIDNHFRDVESLLGDLQAIH